MSISSVSEKDLFHKSKLSIAKLTPNLLNITIRMKSSICGIVTLYSPPDTLIRNIATYIGHIDKLYIIDNSQNTNPDLLASIIDTFSNTEILSYGKNLGIATALNTAIKKGLQENYEWLLTMDQDSFFDDQHANLFFGSLPGIDKNMTAILSPSHQQTPDKSSSAYVKKVEVMTSGNLLNLALTHRIGLFNESLFIDSVDHDYCLRANIAGFDVLQATNCLLRHTVGTSYSGSFLFGMKKKTFNIHSPKRMYFIIRNGLYITSKYKKNFPAYSSMLKRCNKQRISRCLRYGDRKPEYLKYITLGVIDYTLNRFGNKVNI